MACFQLTFSRQTRTSASTAAVSDVKHDLRLFCCSFFTSFFGRGGGDEAAGHYVRPCVMRTIVLTASSCVLPHPLSVACSQGHRRSLVACGNRQLFVPFTFVALLFHVERVSLSL